MTTLTHHMQYKTPLSSMVWRCIAGKMYTPMRIGYALISIKVNIIMLVLVYRLATQASIPLTYIGV